MGKAQGRAAAPSPPMAERLMEAAERAFAAIASPVIAGIAAFNRARVPARDAPHPLLTGIHTPMTEELTLDDLRVEGQIPAALDGRYVRIGPNPVAPDPRLYHFFTGDGMIHGVRLRGGRALWYRNRWIRSTEVAKARRVTPAPGPRHIFDTVNTSILHHAGAGWALVEAGSTPVRFDEHLEAQAYDDFAGTLPGSFTAHPRRDPATGELHALCYEATDPKRVRYNVVDQGGRVRRSVVIPVSHGPLIHDCAITARYVIVLDLPLTLSMRVVLAGRGFPYRWNPDHPARLGLLPREGEAGDIRWIALPPCFVFHTVNAQDLPDGRVALDVIGYDRMFAGDNEAPDEQPRGLERWLIDPEGGTVTQTILDPTPQELPVIDARRQGRPYRFAYALGLPAEPSETLVGEAPLIKHDLHAGTRAMHAFGAGRIAGEFVFVPASPEADEDEGWLIGLVIGADGRSTALEILDARRIEAPPVATVRLPHRIPPGIHGAWLPAEARGHARPQDRGHRH
ncbi:carotenoid oxygenase family protein [Sphingomonas morindae]|uniref:Dioxygenase n=1 Tax=Sphingomonas morindae TaxID=1541170 RepID=A0ABY4XDI5_9SPHN|nr:carotenoid oxygenase family protein [Sphingomonas morindae]USI75039.1 carotenoid oxygenase family protein [Sphingomonas morindae]